MGFGPAATPTLAVAVALARTHADHLLQTGPRSWVVTFRLGTDEARYGRATQVLNMVSGWKATTVEVDGSPEPRHVVLQMLACARGWLRQAGGCRGIFASSRIPPKCRACPLYDPAWALEAGPGRLLPLMLGSEDIEVHVPDHVPEEWMKEG